MKGFMKILRDAIKAIDIMLFGYAEEQERLFRGDDVDDIWPGTGG